MRLNINEIQHAAQANELIYIDEYKVSVFDVTERTVQEYKDATGEDNFEADCTHTQYEICFVDQGGVRRGFVEVGFEENIISGQLGGEDLMTAAGFAEKPAND